MQYQTFNEVWVEVGSFIRTNRITMGWPQVKVYSDYVDVIYKSFDTIRAIPEGANSWRLYPEDGALYLGFTWSFDPDK